MKTANAPWSKVRWMRLYLADCLSLTLICRNDFPCARLYKRPILLRSTRRALTAIPTILPLLDKEATADQAIFWSRINNTSIDARKRSMSNAQPRAESSAIPVTVHRPSGMVSMDW